MGGRRLFLTREGELVTVGRAGRGLSLRYPGGSREVRWSGVEPLPGRVSYLCGRDPNAWKTGFPTYARVRGEQIYPGIDVEYYSVDGRLEYDFVVHPGADPRQIRLAFAGPKGAPLPVRIDAGELKIAAGSEEARQLRPAVYQEVGGRRQPVDGGYQQLASGEIGFRLGAYDRSRALVIDPVLIFSQRFGGTDLDSAAGVGLDAAGNIYLAGQTASANFPGAAPPAHQTVLVEPLEAFVTKLSPDGGTVLYSTYLGGTLNDAVNALVMDGTSVCLAGTTESHDFPIVGGYQGYSGKADGFLAKLSADGTSLAFSTYFGGVLDDSATALAIDSQHHLHLAGQTASVNLPILNGFRGGPIPVASATEAYLAVFDPAATGGASLLFSTTLGGSADETATTVAVDRFGKSYLAGWTTSVDFLVTPGAYDTAAAGAFEAFVAKIDSTLGPTGLVYSTYLGGTANDAVRAMRVDTAGTAWVAGETLSADFPLVSPLKPGIKAQDAFLARLDAVGAKLLYSTAYGGTDAESATAIATDPAGNLYLAGNTASSDFPAVSGLQTYRGGGDAFILKLNATGRPAVFATPFGGTAADEARAIAVGSTEKIYLAGATLSADLPIKGGANSGSAGVDADAFIASALGPPSSPVSLSAKATDSATVALAWKDTSSSETSFVVTRKTGTGAYITLATLGGSAGFGKAVGYTDTTASANLSYTYAVKAVGPGGSSPVSGVLARTLSAPTNVRLTASPMQNGAAMLGLTWTSTAVGLTGHEIWRQIGTGPWVLVGTIAAGSFARWQDFMPAHSTYSYKLRAYYSTTSFSSFSATVSNTTL
jgi:hypothetical protein